MKIEGETKRLPQFRPFLLFFPSSIIIPETSDGIKFDIRMQCNIVTSFYCIRILLIIISIFVIQNTVSLENLESIESKVSFFPPRYSRRIGILFIDSMNQSRDTFAPIPTEERTLFLPPGVSKQ